MKPLKVERRLLEQAKHCQVLNINRTHRRTIGLIQGTGVHLCWVSTGGETYCSCRNYKYRLGLCEHLTLLVSLFTDYWIQVI